MADTSRRSFLKRSGAVGAGGAAVGLGVPVRADAQESERATLRYPDRRVGDASALTENTPVDFLYPDERSPCALIKMGRAIPGGAGPDRDIVAYSILCTHMGYPLEYEADARRFKCNCHYSMFDPEQSAARRLARRTSASLKPAARNG